MSKLDELPDDVQLVATRMPSYVPVGPIPPPLMPRARRPPLGQALSLAETSLARGDAFDAAAQFRTLLAGASPDASPYLELQLSRAYAELGDLDQAEAVLRARIRVNTSQAWPAVFELATLLVRYRDADAYETWESLAPLADPLRFDLAHHLLQIASSETARVRLAGVTAPPPPGIILACEASMAEFLAKPPHGLPSWEVCPARAGRGAAVRRTSAEVIQLDRIAWQVRNWHAASRRRSPEDAERWMRIAHDQADTVDLASISPAAKIASWLALLAYQNAANVAAENGGVYYVTRDYHVYAHSNIVRLHPDVRDQARRLADSFLRVQP